MSGDLLQTKLYVPRLRPSLVSRPHLSQQLTQGLHLDHKLTLISAPAGFGKTTLVSEWVENLQLNSANDPPIVNRKSSIENRIAWLSLDENDNDPTRFLTYFVAALNQIEGMETAIGTDALSMLQSPQPPPPQTVLTSLINEVSTLPIRIVLVLDDYHVIDAASVDDALTFLLEHLPPSMHLVIATRDDPQLPLARLRARGQLTELRAADLRFTESEAAEFLNQVMGLNLSPADIAALESRTEGWITGLQLAAISMRGVKDVTSFIKSFTGSHRFVLDYLIEEVLNQQSEDVQRFLLQTAVLTQLTGSLCDALTNQNNGQTTLELLERANLFIVPLDEQREWYRYHHLFADLLRQRLRQTHLEQIPRLHLQASKWYEQKERLPDAIRHAFAAEDFRRVADLAELAWPAWSGNVESLTWLSWVNALPSELVRPRPVLNVAYAQALLNVGQLEAAEARLLDAEQWMDGPSSIIGPEQSRRMIVVDEAQFQTLAAWLATTRAYHAQAVGDMRSSVKYVEQALDLFPEDDTYNRAALTGLLGLANWASGNLEAAHKTFSVGLFQSDHDRIKGTFVLADMQMALGHLREAERSCEYGLQLAKEFDEPNPIGTEDVYSGISEIHREQGKLAAAAQDLHMCNKLGEQVELPDWQHRWCIAQSRLEVSMGNLEAAVDLLDEAARVYVRTPVPEVRPIAAMKARVWVKQDRLTEALAWAREQDLSVDDNLSYLREFEHITLARILIARYQRDQGDASIHAAIGFLEHLLKAAEAGVRIGSVIEILVLQALAFEAQGNISPALVSLERALTLAAPEGYFQLFVDEGPPMAHLLHEALSRGVEPNYVQRLLSAFPSDKPGETVQSKPQTQEFDWIEPLSEREIEVLQLIANGLTNPQIAARLFLSLNTVKVHTRNIYSKLDAHNRTQAVARARALNILPA